MLYHAQQACIDAENFGCPISEDLYLPLKSRFQNRDDPYLYEGTSEDGFKLAMRVMQMECCTETQFNEFCATLNFNLLSSEDLTLDTLSKIKQANVIVRQECHLSETAQRMHQKIAESANANTSIRMTNSDMALVRKDIETMMENMFTDPRVSKQDIMDWQRKVIEARSDMVEKINNRFGQKGGGYRRKEWAGCSNPKGSRKKSRMKGLTG